MTTRRFLSILLPAAAFLAMLPACRHRDLCCEHPIHDPICRAVIVASYNQQWEIPAEPPFAIWPSQWPQDFPVPYDSLRPGIPEGLRIMSYGPDGVARDFNRAPFGGEIYFDTPGLYNFLFYNNDMEFVKLEDPYSWSTSKATTRSRTRASYTGNRFYHPKRSGSQETTLAPPDMLYGAFVNAFPVEASLGPWPEIKVELQPLVFTYVVHLDIEQGLEWVRQARGALAGVAQGVWLSNGTTTDEAATLLYDCMVLPSGIHAEVRTFGIPGYPKPEYSRNAGRFAITFELNLSNGKVMQFDFDITDQMAAQPRGGVIRVGGVVITKEDGESKGSGFQVDVNEWGEEEKIEM